MRACVREDLSLCMGLAGQWMALEERRGKGTAQPGMQEGAVSDIAVPSSVAA